MACDLQLVDRIRMILGPRRGVAEKKMFGGVCFTVNGNMCCGVAKKLRDDDALRSWVDRGLAFARSLPAK